MNTKATELHAYMCKFSKSLTLSQKKDLCLAIKMIQNCVPEVSKLCLPSDYNAMKKGIYMTSTVFRRIYHIQRYIRVEVLLMFYYQMLLLISFQFGLYRKKHLIHLLLMILYVILVQLTCYVKC